MVNNLKLQKLKLLYLIIKLMLMHILKIEKVNMKLK